MDAIEPRKRSERNPLGLPCKQIAMAITYQDHRLIEIEAARVGLSIADWLWKRVEKDLKRLRLRRKKSK